MQGLCAPKARQTRSLGLYKEGHEHRALRVTSAIRPIRWNAHETTSSLLYVPETRATVETTMNLSSLSTLVPLCLAVATLSTPTARQAEDCQPIIADMPDVVCLIGEIGDAIASLLGNSTNTTLISCADGETCSPLPILGALPIIGSLLPIGVSVSRIL